MPPLDARAKPPASYRLFLGFFQAVLLITIGTNVTIIGELALGEQFWRLGLVLNVLTVFIFLVYCRGHIKWANNLDNPLLHAFLFIGPFLILVFVETVKALVNDHGRFAVQGIILRLLTFLPAIGAIFLVGGGDKDAREGLRSILKPYVYFCLYISFTGIISWLLIQLNMINPSSWPVPYDLSHKLTEKSFSEAGGNLYYFPFYLGLIMKASELLSFYRTTGLSFEPHVAGLFLAPAVFAIHFTFPHWSNRLIKVCIITMIIFLFLTFSVATIMIMASMIIPIIIKMVSHSQHSRSLYGYKIFILSIVFCITVPLISENHRTFILDKIDTRSGIEPREFITQVFAANSILGTGLFTDYRQDRKNTEDFGVLSMIALVGSTAFLSFLGLMLFFSRRDTAFLGLSLLYVVLHSIKDPPHVISWTFYLFILCVACLAASIPPERPQREMVLPAAQKKRWLTRRAVTSAFSFRGGHKQRDCGQPNDFSNYDS